MRELLFRGKRVDNGEWVEGQTVVVIHQDDNDLIFMPQHGEDVKADPMEGNDRALTSIYGNYYQILPQTVEQYTGLTDKNGKKIFEGDIVEYPIESGGYKEENIHEVVFENRHGTAYFGIKLRNIETWGFDMLVPSKLMKVIGNIHDNPELLEVK